MWLRGSTFQGGAHPGKSGWDTTTLSSGFAHLDAEIAYLAIERRTADAEPARHFRHLAAVFVQRKTDHVALHLGQPTQPAAGVEHRDAVAIAVRRCSSDCCPNRG